VRARLYYYAKSGGTYFETLAVLRDGVVVRATAAAPPASQCLTKFTPLASHFGGGVVIGSAVVEGDVAAVIFVECVLEEGFRPHYCNLPLVIRGHCYLKIRDGWLWCLKYPTLRVKVMEYPPRVVWP